MKKSTLVIIFLVACNFLIGQKDSLRLNSFHGFYLNVYYPHRFSSFYQNYSKYSDDYYYNYEVQKYNYQIPGFGLGYVLNYKGFFVKTDVNYWVGSKHISDDVGFRAYNKDDPEYYSSFPSFSLPSIGSRYYYVKDHIEGTLNIYYLDIALAVTGNITRNFRMYSGFRINYALNYAYRAKMNREAALYEVVGYTSQYSSRDSLISTEYLEYNNKDVKSRTIQSIGGYFFFNTGINFNFKVKDELFLVDLLYETNKIGFLKQGVIARCVTFKLGYVFNYAVFRNKNKYQDKSVHLQPN